MNSENKLSIFDKVHKPVFFTSSLLILLLLLVSSLYPYSTENTFIYLQKSIIQYGSWFYILSVAIFLITVVYLGIGKHGDIKLGPDHSEPDYSYLSWFSMLFSAGMGIGIVFFGIAEPVIHFLHPPDGSAQTAAAAQQAMEITFFHWGLHSWAIYAIVGLNLAYFSYRHRLPLTLRSALYPVLGKKIKGIIGDMVDIFAVLSTVFGVSTSLGYGVFQINGGLNYLIGLPQTSVVQVTIIVVITAMATVSVITGLDKGVKFLSELNLLVALFFMVLILFLGPTQFILTTFVQNTGNYFSEIVNKTFNLYAYTPTEWIGGWTLLYWGWWIAWSPFVGMFIARISRGRTIKEFCFGVIFVPTGLTFAWMTIFGGSALYKILFEGASNFAQIVDANKAVALFQFLEFFPFSKLLSVIAVIMVTIFFITSADSGSLVVDSIASNGKEDTPTWQRIYWSILTGVIAIVLILMGGLAALQIATIVSALPFACVLLLACYGLLKSLEIESAKKISMLHPMNTSTIPAGYGDYDWKDRIESILMLPEATKVKNFLKTTVNDAFEEVAKAFTEKNISVSVEKRHDYSSLKVGHGDEIDFYYAIRIRAYEPPTFALSSIKDKNKNRKYFRAEVFLREGGQNYDITGYSKEQVIHDVLDQYEKHMHFLELIR